MFTVSKGQATLNSNNEGEACQADTVEIPQAYLCSFTKKIMCNPVFLLDDGDTYEKEAIEDSIKNNTNPSTGEAIKVQGIYCNTGLKGAIDNFIKKYAYNKSVQEQVYITKQERIERKWLDAAKRGASRQEFMGILGEGVSPFAKDKLGNTVIHLACSSQYPLRTTKNILTVLAEKEKQERQNANNNNEQKDEQAPAHRKHDTLKQLLDMVNNLSQSALHNAARLNEGGLAVFLVQFGLDMYAMDVNGATPFDMANDSLKIAIIQKNTVILTKQLKESKQENKNLNVQLQQSEQVIQEKSQEITTLSIQLQNKDQNITELTDQLRKSSQTNQDLEQLVGKIKKRLQESNKKIREHQQIIQKMGKTKNKQEDRAWQLTEQNIQLKRELTLLKSKAPPKASSNTVFSNQNNNKEPIVKDTFALAKITNTNTVGIKKMLNGGREWLSLTTFIASVSKWEAGGNELWFCKNGRYGEWLALSYSYAGTRGSGQRIIIHKVLPSKSEDGWRFGMVIWPDALRYRSLKGLGHKMREEKYARAISMKSCRLSMQQRVH